MEPSPTTKRRGNLVFAAGVLLVVLAVAGGYYVLLWRPAPVPPPVAPPVLRSPQGVQVTRAAGAVQIRVGAGEWHEAVVGTAVEVGADLRTGEGGSAALSIPGTLDVEVAADAEVRLETLDDDQAALEVREGLVVADVKPESGRLLQIKAAGSDAVAATRDGRVHVLTDGKGNVQTAVTRGSATVTAGGEQVELENGFQTSIVPGGKPQAPTPMPKSLLLKIKWPPDSQTAKRRQLVTGKTNPGARVRVGGVVTTADANGQFRAVIELQEGSQKVRAYTLDVLGRVEQTTSQAIELDTRGPKNEIKTHPNMWKRPAGE
ncbi:MAG: FecR domain-containing protein [Deltaproteobacteria bacterium]|nr:FecR domain-containing protein [Deltaproteobacteria bacterium]